MSKRVLRSPTHPAERFIPAGSMERGGALKHLVGRHSVDLLAESIAAVAPRFDVRRFKRRALENLEPLELMRRAEHVAAALAEQLPADFDEAGPILVAALGPELTATEGNGLAPFFYLPHSCYIGRYGADSFEAGMQACYELTKRFTAEYCVRPLLIVHPGRALRRLRSWTADPSPHVRRLVSEGSRPRLPWGLRLRAFQADPLPTLALLERLKDDPQVYVRRSVANHLGDILKDNPTAAYRTCERWTREARSATFAPERAAARFWIVRHAVRLPAKKGDARALAIRARAAVPRERAAPTAQPRVAKRNPR
jgi:3-methyladenine DNA glycosylase AlkC